MTAAYKADEHEVSGIRTGEFDGLDPMRQQKIDWARTFVRIPREVKVAATAHARKRKVSFNSLLIHALIEIVNRMNEQEAKGKAR